MLAEIRAPTEPGDFPHVAEDDLGVYGNTRLLYGRVVYTHAGAIDRPLEIVRMSADVSAVLVPHTDWSGGYDLVTFTGTEHARCGPELGGEPACYPVELPESGAWHEVMAPSYTATYRGPRSWSGNLLTGKRDQSGLLYMRNRYYDPATGRFTQEDPIGIAGGLNVYGFAAGDPVSYSDPFGLKVCFTGPRSDRRRLIRATEDAIHGHLDVDSQGCVEGVEGRGSDHTEFQELADSPLTYTIGFGSGGSAFEAGAFFRRITIDRREIGAPYWQLTWRTGCTKTGRATLPQLLAHELGHAYDYHRGVEHPPLQSRSTTEEWCMKTATSRASSGCRAAAIEMWLQKRGPAVRTLFAALGGALVLACSASAEMDRPLAEAGEHERRLNPCPRDSSSTEGWQRARARFGGFTLLLPPTAARSHVERDPVAPGENWQVEEGFDVAYRLHRDPEEPRPLSKNDLGVVICEEQIGGSRAQLRMFYATTTYVPGQYVTASWDDVDGRMLVLQAVAGDSLRRNELMSIIRSVEFTR